MNRQLNMRHLHLGCGEPLSQLLPEQAQPKTAQPPLKEQVVRVLQKPKQTGGRR